MKENNENSNLNCILQLAEFCKANNITIDLSKYSYNNNIIERFKKGNKIKIKKENKGKFTDYCNGKVTSECINRGKNSPDPKIRKRATFAQSVRSWNNKK